MEIINTLAHHLNQSLHQSKDLFNPADYVDAQNLKAIIFNASTVLVALGTLGLIAAIAKKKIQSSSLYLGLSVLGAGLLGRAVVEKSFTNGLPELTASLLNCVYILPGLEPVKFGETTLAYLPLFAQQSR
jgi:hypothetical protein